MSRPPPSSPIAQRLLPVALVVLVITSFLPPGWGEWAGAFGRLVRFFVAPISQPVRGLTGWLSPPDERGPETQVVRSLEDQAESYRQQLLRTRQENEQLRDLIAELQRGIRLNPDLPVRQMHAAVIGNSSDLESSLMWIRAGSSDGVDVNSVATARGLQLLGRVVASDGKTCHVQPITSRRAGQIRGVVMLAETAVGPECLLEPQGDGTFRGPVEDLREWPSGVPLAPDHSAGQPVRAVVGQSVRLRDPNWPKSSQMLMVGTVESVEPAPDQPLRQIVTVRPTLRLERVSEVVLRLSTPGDDEPAQRPSAEGGTR
jgi:cell shape-determining protein MreC